MHLRGSWVDSQAAGLLQHAGVAVGAVIRAAHGQVDERAEHGAGFGSGSGQGVGGGRVPGRARLADLKVWWACYGNLNPFHFPKINLMLKYKIARRELLLCIEAEKM